MNLLFGRKLLTGCRVKEKSKQVRAGEKQLLGPAASSATDLTASLLSHTSASLL